jgi:copper chaperone
MDNITLTVKGMTCMGCAKSVKSVLEVIPGVSSVDITLDAGRVILSYDGAQAGAGQFRSAIEEAGFEVVA